MGEHPSLGREFGREIPKTLADLLDLYSCVLKRQIIEALVAGEANVTPLAERIGRVVPHVSKAAHELCQAGMVLIVHHKRFHTCSLSERVAVRHEGMHTYIELTALNGNRLRVGIGRLASAERGWGYNGVAVGAG